MILKFQKLFLTGIKIKFIVFEINIRLPHPEVIVNQEKIALNQNLNKKIIKKLLVLIKNNRSANLFKSTICLIKAIY
jgi:UDP-N-acetylmuramyl pentapeptide synthase